MAKSKRSAALFEVIQANRLPANGPLARTRRWWFGRNPHTTTPRQSALALPTAPAPCETLVEQPPAIAETPGPAELQPPKQPIPGVDLLLDPDHQQITFKVSYYSAIVTASTIVVAIALAFVVGRKMSRGPIAATASPSSAELRSQPAHPEVLDIGSGAVTTQTELLSRTVDTAQLAANKSPTTLPSHDDTQRIIGRQYVVIQIYPEMKSADEAASLLNRNNIHCTVEKGLAGWASKSWWCVVGTTGFDHVRSNPDYQRYEAAVNRLSEQFAPNSKFKKFEPRAYRWKESTT
jgi:hypothetical protein